MSKPNVKPTMSNTSKSKKPAAKKSRSSQSAIVAKPSRSQKAVRAEPTAMERKPLLSAPKLLVGACRILTDHWKLFAGILLIYALLSIVLVGSLGGGNLTSLKQSVSGIFSGHFSKLSGGLTLFALMASSSSNNTSGGGSVYQLVLVLVTSLALIWALRQIYNQQKVRIRDTFYLGMYPLVPFVLVLLVIGLQLLPIAVAGILYSLVIGGGIAVLAIEQIVCIAICIFLAVLSLYWVCSSIFALYIVTLPDMTPIKALRSARELVNGRRKLVLRKLVFLAIVLVVVSSIIIVPIVITATVLATPIFFVLSVIGLALIHGYLYGLYRELAA